MLQQHFNNNTFKLEENIYNQEGIDWKAIDFIDNEPMIDLITKKRTGILPILDEELKVPNGSDKGFLRKLEDKQMTSPIFICANNIVPLLGFANRNLFFSLVNIA